MYTSQILLISLKGERKIKLNKYFSYCRNINKNMGGVATLLADSLKQNTKFVKVKKKTNIS